MILEILRKHEINYKNTFKGELVNPFYIFTKERVWKWIMFPIFCLMFKHKQNMCLLSMSITCKADTSADDR